MNLTETSLQFELDRRDLADPALTVDFPLQIPGPDYADILQWLAPAPHGTALLGLCQDGLPLLMNMAGTEPGGLVLLDNQPDRSRALLNLIIASAIQLSSPNSIEVILISPRLEQFPYPPEGAYAFSWAEPWEMGAMDLLRSFLAAASGQQPLPSEASLRLLILDEADRILPYLDRYTQEFLAWAAANGPAQRCRVIASATSGDRLASLDGFLPSFRTRVYGHHPASRPSQDPLPPQIHPADHARDGYFSIDHAGEALPFWLPGE